MTCRLCRDGLLEREMRCCSCQQGRDRARRVARSYAKEREADRIKRERLAEAKLGHDFSPILKRVPKVKDYGFGGRR